MGKKIFVSYKYADRLVRHIPGSFYGTTVRDYVDFLQARLDASDHIYKGENDGESLQSLADSTISSKLGDKIFDSTVTVVLISKGMKDNTPDDTHWIPWEISYSLRQQSRLGRTSKTNAVLGIILPDDLGSYSYYYHPNPECNSTTHLTGQLFAILRDNMFNIKQPDTRTCNGTVIHEGYFSYIHTAKWDDFIGNIDYYVDVALEICRNSYKYNIRKNV
jgi:hypothetical protein